MSRTARPWRGAGCCCWVARCFPALRAFGADEPPISNQLADLGRQALAQGANRTAETFFKKSLELDPANEAATEGLSKVKRADQVLRVAMQEPKPAQKPAAPAAETPPPPPPGTRSPPTPKPPLSRRRQPRTSRDKS